MKKEEANKTRTKLLTIINKESTLYLKTRSSMKINSKTSEEILSQFDNYEITINHCVITGIPSRSTHTKKVKRMNSLRPTMEEDIDGEALDNNIYTAPSQFEAMFISDAHTKEDLLKTCEIIGNYQE